MDSIGFIILRHSRNEATDGLCGRCYRSVRAFYPVAPVLIVDDGSSRRDPCEPLYAADSNAIVVSACEEEIGCGELLPYAHALRRRFAPRVITLHDSMVLRAPLPRRAFEVPLAFLWHFDAHVADDPGAFRPLIASMRGGEALAQRYDGDDWKGCFGAAAVATLDALDVLQREADLLGLMPRVRTREARMALERAFGVACFAAGLVTGGLREDDTPCSLFGSIFEHPRAFDRTASLADVSALDYAAPVLKTWHGR